MNYHVLILFKFKKYSNFAALLGKRGTTLSPSLFFGMDEIRDITQYVEGLLEPEQFIVEVTMKGNGNNMRVQVLLDSDNALTIAACSKISRALGNQIEETELISNKYMLEVSSPGLDHPLKHLRQYKKNQGREIKIDRLDGSSVKGKLINATTEAVTIETEKKSKTDNSDVIDIPFDQIDKTKVLITFNK